MLLLEEIRKRDYPCLKTLQIPVLPAAVITNLDSAPEASAQAKVLTEQSITEHFVVTTVDALA